MQIQLSSYFLSCLIYFRILNLQILSIAFENQIITTNDIIIFFNLIF